MGNAPIIRQDRAGIVRTTGLAQLRNLGVKVCEGAFQHLPVAGILGSFELLEDSSAGQEQALTLSLAGELVRGEPGAELTGSGRGVRLLLFDRFAFPPTGHGEIISRQGRSALIEMGLSAANGVGSSGVKGKDVLRGFEHHLNHSVIQRGEDGAIKLRFGGEDSACHRSSFGSQAHKLFPPVRWVADSADVAALLQTVEQQHQNIFIQGEVSGDLLLGYRFRTAGGQQYPDLSCA
jgi:hypothetical protein